MFTLCAERILVPLGEVPSVARARATRITLCHSFRCQARRSFRPVHRGTGRFCLAARALWRYGACGVRCAWIGRTGTIGVVAVTLRLIGLLYAVQVDGILHHDAGDAGIDRAVPLPLQRLVGGVQALGAFQQQPVRGVRRKLGRMCGIERVVGARGEVHREHGPVERVGIGENGVAGLDQLLELLHGLLVELEAAEGVGRAARIRGRAHQRHRQGDTPNGVGLAKRARRHDAQHDPCDGGDGEEVAGDKEGMHGVGEAQAHQDGAKPRKHARAQPGAQHERLLVVLCSRGCARGVHGVGEQREEAHQQDLAQKRAAAKLEWERETGCKRRDVLQPKAVGRPLEGVKQDEQPGKVGGKGAGAGGDHLAHVRASRERDDHEGEEDEARGEEAVVVAVGRERRAQAQRDVSRPRVLLQAGVQQAEACEHEEGRPGVHAQLGVVRYGVVHERPAQHGACRGTGSKLPSNEGGAQGERRPVRDERCQAIGPCLVSKDAVEHHEHRVEERRVHICRRGIEHLLEAHVREQDREALVAPEIVGEDAGHVDAEQDDGQERDENGSEPARLAGGAGIGGCEGAGGRGGVRRGTGA